MIVEISKVTFLFQTQIFASNPSIIGENTNTVDEHFQYTDGATLLLDRNRVINQTFD